MFKIKTIFVSLLAYVFILLGLQEVVATQDDVHADVFGDFAPAGEALSGASPVNKSPDFLEVQKAYEDAKKAYSLAKKQYVGEVRKSPLQMMYEVGLQKKELENKREEKKGIIFLDSKK